MQTFFLFFLAEKGSRIQYYYCMKKALLLLASVALLFGCNPSNTAKTNSAEKKAPAPQQQVCQKAKSKPCEKKVSNRKVGVAMYTFHRRTIEDVIPLLKEMGVDAIGLSTTPLSAKFPKAKTGYKMTPEQKEFLKKLLADNKMKIVSYGVVTPTEEKDIIAVCEFAKEMNIPLILTEAVGKQYGLKMALHNHAHDLIKRNSYFNPNIVKATINGYENLYACPDNGHWARSGINAIAGYKILEGRIAMLHFKDLDKFDDLKALPLPHGQGVLNVKELIAYLDSVKYDGYYMIEYEKNFENNVDDVRACVKFLKSN